mmetsp:Transcript_19325/g.21504  ORF Transcript_19325/g.21504 Transcript_19325/m.21504 type:complete len:409 (+) Transcript_19325:46-1272(+)
MAMLKVDKTPLGDLCQIVAAYSGAQLESITKDSAAIQLDDGATTLTDVYKVCSHLAGDKRDQLFGTDAAVQTGETTSVQIKNWWDKAVLPEKGFLAALASGEKKQMFPALSLLKKALIRSVYLVNNRLSVADLLYFSAVHRVLPTLDDADRFNRFPEVLRWYDNIQHLPAFTHAPKSFYVFIERNVPEKFQKGAKTVKSDSRTVPGQKGGKGQQQQGNKKQKQKNQNQPKGGNGGKKGNKAPAPVDISRCDIRVGQITAIHVHPEKDGLYVETVDMGEENPRTIVSGLAKYIKIEDMKNRKVIVLANTKPSKLGGVVSQGMVIAASSEDHSTVELVDPPADSKPGDKIKVEGYDGEPDKRLNPKRKVFQKLQPDLKTTDECVATYKGLPLMAPTGPCKTATMKNCHLG